MTRDGDKFRPARVDELAPARLRSAVRSYRSSGRQRFTFEVDGTSYIAGFTKFPATFGKTWTVGVVVPVSDFLGTFTERTRIILVISSVALVVGIAAIAAVSRSISRPIKRLADETDKIRRLEVEETVDIRSRIAETRELNDSLARTKTAIRAFARFVPKSLVHQLMETGEGVELGGELRDLTVMFSDIEGFTGISETMLPEGVMLHLSDYFNEITQIIQEQRGTIDKYSGDSVMAFWGAPVPDEDHVSQACLAALLASKRVDELNGRWEAAGKPALRTRFGLHCGEMVVGNVGSTDRMNYTVLGDAVNIASRLEGVNKEYGSRICVSRSVHDRVCDQFLMRPLDTVIVKGRTEPVEIYELIAAFAGLPSIVATEQDRERCQLTADGAKAYREGRREAAIVIFTALAERFPGDELAAVYLAKCRSGSKGVQNDRA